MSLLYLTVWEPTESGSFAKKPLPPDPEFMSRRRRPQVPCGPQCFLHANSEEETPSESEVSSEGSAPNLGEAEESSVGEMVQNTGRQLASLTSSSTPGSSSRCNPSWTKEDQVVFNVYKPIFGHNYCAMAKVIGSKSCRQVQLYARTVPDAAHVEPTPEPPKKKKKKVESRFKSSASVRLTRNKDIGPDLTKHYEPCYHPDKPCNKGCSCFDSQMLCEKYCLCDSKTCRNFFHGCYCRGLCEKNTCPCFAANRECDPDLCKTCGACDDFNLKHTKCKNVAIQRCQRKVRVWNVVLVLVSRLDVYARMSPLIIHILCFVYC
jgi:histone-lysine N-methyltransferase EZH2